MKLTKPGDGNLLHLIDGKLDPRSSWLPSTDTHYELETLGRGDGDVGIWHKGHTKTLNVSGAGKEIEQQMPLSRPVSKTERVTREAVVPVREETAAEYLAEMRNHETLPGIVYHNTSGSNKMWVVDSKFHPNDVMQFVHSEIKGGAMQVEEAGALLAHLGHAKTVAASVTETPGLPGELGKHVETLTKMAEGLLSLGHGASGDALAVLEKNMARAVKV